MFFQIVSKLTVSKSKIAYIEGTEKLTTFCFLPGES